MTTLTIERDRLDRVRPGDVVTGIDGHRLPRPRTVAAAYGEVAFGGVRGLRLVPPPGSGIEWNLYEGNIHHGLTVERRRVRVFRSGPAAAKAWGRAHGIVNRGGSLYWDAETVEDAEALAAATPFGVKVLLSKRLWTGDRMVRGLLVTGYSPDAGHAKGWEALATRLVRRGLITVDGDRFEVQP